jgi:CRP-like cAMP-binding protein
VSAVLDKMAQEVEAKLQKVEEEIKAKTGPLVDERDEYVAILKKLKKNTKSGASTSVISDEKLVEALGKLTSAPGAPAVKTKDIAEALGVSGQNVARKLSKLAGSGVITGNKDDGYSV